MHDFPLDQGTDRCRAFFIPPIGRSAASTRASRAEDALALAEARFSAVERLAGIARQEAVDAVLVAGDVFDAQTVSDRTIRRLFNAMGAYVDQVRQAN